MKYNHEISPEELEQIERYLQNEMTADEAAAFAGKIRTDESLREKTEEVRLTLLGIAEAVLSEKLDEYHENIRPVKTAERSRVFSLKWALAASLVFIVAISAWWFARRMDVDQRIYSKYYKPDPGLMTVMSPGNSNYDFEKAMVEYKNGEYDKALAAWSRLLKEKPGNDTLIYFTGAASQASADYDAAIRYLQTVAGDANSGFRKDACWYLGLAYLQKGAKDKAIMYLQMSEHEESEQVINAIRH